MNCDQSHCVKQQLSKYTDFIAFSLNSAERNNAFQGVTIHYFALNTSHHVYTVLLSLIVHNYHRKYTQILHTSENDRALIQLLKQTNISRKHLSYFFPFCMITNLSDQQVTYSPDSPACLETK